MADDIAAVDESLAFLYRAAATRDPTKRPVRVVSRERLVANFGAFGVSDDEDDQDFQVDENSDEDESDDDSDDAGSQDVDKSDEESDGDGQQEEEDSDNGTANPSQRTLCSGLSTVNNSPEESNLDAAVVTSSTDMICSICLNLKNTTEEVVQCDLCGLTVHEGCYGIMENNSEDGSETSSETTEPWFCEPCLAGLNPRCEGDVYCELCPVRGGAYKQTDQGRWVHLLCAFYNSSVTFGDTERLSNVCLWNLAQSQYGAKSCTICTNKLLSRTGVCVKCDAGMCKTYVHVMCALKQGLLVDSLLNATDDATENTVADPYYVCCSAHSDRTSVKLKKHQYLKLEAQNAKFIKKTLSDREQECLRLKRDKFFDLFPSVKKQFSNAVSKTADDKQQRLMSSSYEFMTKMKHKSEFCTGINEEQWETEFRIGFTPDMIGRYAMPAAFSSDFVSYYNEREKIIPTFGSQVRKLKISNEKLKRAQENVKEKLETAEKNYKNKSDITDKKYDKLKSWCAVLKKYNCKNVKLLDAPPNFKRRPVEESPPPPTSKLGVSQQKSSVAVDEKRKLQTKTKSSENSPKKVSGKKFPAVLPRSPIMAIKSFECATCHKSTDQHLMAHCDTCKLHYHLSCLDPPLTKMPRKTAAYGWECSSCSRRSSSSDEEEEHVVDVNAPRQLRTSHKPVQRYIAENPPEPSPSTNVSRRKPVEKAHVSKPKRTVEIKKEVAQPPPSASANKNLIMAEVDDIVANVMKKVFSSDNSATKTTASSNSNVSPDHHNRKNGVVNNDVKRKKVINSYEVGSFKRAKLLKPGVGTSLHLVSDSSSLRSPGLDDESSSDDDDDESSVAGQGCYDVGALDNMSNGSIMSSPPKKRMQYQKISLTKAINAVFTGEMGAKRASQVFGVPRSTIGRHIRQMKTVQQSSMSSSSSDRDNSRTVQVIRVEDLE